MIIIKEKEAMNLRVEGKQVEFEEEYLGVAGDKKMSRESSIILFQFKNSIWLIFNLILNFFSKTHSTINTTTYECFQECVFVTLSYEVPSACHMAISGS